MAPLLERPTIVVIQAAAAGLFSATNSARGKLPWKGAGAFNPAESGLVKLPAFRKLLARELEVTNICDSVEWRGPGMLSYQLTNSVNTSGSYGLALPEAEQPAVGTKVALRWCDWIALSLAHAKQIPPFNPFAPLDKREEMTEHAQVLLQNP